MFNVLLLGMVTVSWRTCLLLLGMVTVSWRTCLRPPKFHPNQFTDRQLMAFQTFFNMTAIRHLLTHSCHRVLICCCVPNFNKTGSRIRPPDAHNCYMFNVWLLGNCHYHSNCIMADMLGRLWDVTT